MLRGLFALVVAGIVVLVAPAVASADVTISTSASSNVQTSLGGVCTFQATAANANVDVSTVDSCLQSGWEVDVEGDVSGGGDLVVNAPITPTSCDHLALDDGVASIIINDAISTPGCGVTLTSADAITGNAAITTGGLITTSTGNATLGTDASDDVSSFQATATNGSVTLLNDNAGTLELEGVTASAGVDVVNGGDIDVMDPLAAGSGQTATLKSEDGAITQEPGGLHTGPYITAGELAVYGDSAGGSTTPLAGDIELSQKNTIGALYASANYGVVNITSLSGSQPVQLLGLQSTQDIIVSDSSGPLETVGPITAPRTVVLTGDGFIMSGGTLTATDAFLSDTNSSDSWTVTPATISTQGLALTYSGVAGLWISGGSVFNITPSPVTGIRLYGTSGTLNYNAGGGTAAVSTNGITQSGTQGVGYSGMTEVDIENGVRSPPPPPELGFPLREPKLATVSRTRRLTALCSLAGPGTCTARVTLSAATAKKLKLRVPKGSKTIAVASATQKLINRGSVMLTFRLRANIANALKRVRLIKLTIVASSLGLNDTACDTTQTITLN